VSSRSVCATDTADPDARNARRQLPVASAVGEGSVVVSKVWEFLNGKL
jgi:hypothetical protein